MLFCAAALSFTACNNDENADGTANSDSVTTTTTTEMGGTGAVSYVDLRSGRTVTKDEATGRYVDDAGSPVDFYVDINARDTFYGMTGQNVNNALLYENGDWKLDETKVSSDNGQAEGSNGDMKTKTDGDESKLKTDDVKVKTEGDETKVKTR